MLNFPRNKTLSDSLKSGMPQMDMTLTGWEIPLDIIRIRQEVTDGELSYNEDYISFRGVWQPLRDKQLELKPEGQRAWEWIWLHARASELNLELADKVIFRDKQFKVMSKKDYGLNAFVEYQLCRDYQDEFISEEDA